MPIRPVTFDETDLKKIFRTDTKFARFWRALKRIIQTVFSFAVLFGVFFLAINFPAFLKRANYSAQAVPPVTIPQPAPVVPEQPKITYVPEIIVPKLGLQAPVIYDATYTTILDRLHDGVVRYEGTADPGQVGNVVILGHSSALPWDTGHYKTIFALLDQLSVGDQIILPYQTERYTYTVSDKKIVKASDVSVLSRTNEPRLNLITCYPVGTAAKRLVITANLSAGPVGSTQATEPFLGTQLVNAR